MQDPRAPLFRESLNAKARKKNVSSSRASVVHSEENEDREVHQRLPIPSKKQPNAKKRNSKNDDLLSNPHPERSSSESLPDSSTSGDDYRLLRRKYLLLEEEIMAPEKELNVYEVDISALESEKHALLDKLVVLEGLVDPAEVQKSSR